MHSWVLLTFVEGRISESDAHEWSTSSKSIKRWDSVVLGNAGAHE